MGVVETACEIILALFGLFAYVPLIAVSLIANPIIVSRNWDNPCDDLAPISLCTWLTVASVVTLALSAVAIICFCLMLGVSDETQKKINVVLVFHGIVFFAFLVAWACVGGWLVFGSGPASGCRGNELGELTVANFACQVVATLLGWMLYKLVIKMN